MSEVVMSEVALNEFIKASGIAYFTGSETLQLLRLGETAPVPPREWWERIITPLQMADRMRNELGHPLVIANGYRPKELNDRAGGARRSQHLFYRALDIQLPRDRIGNRECQQRLYACVAGLFLRFDSLKFGLGIYRRNGGDRVHIDIGYKRRYWGGPGKRWVKDLLAENR